MKQQKQYQSIDEYIQYADIANENGLKSDGFFDEAIVVLQKMKQASPSTNIVNIAGEDTNDISSEEYDELIEWLESLDKTHH